MVLRPPAMEQMRRTSGFSVKERSWHSRKSAAASLSPGVRMSSNSTDRPRASARVNTRISSAVVPKPRGATDERGWTRIFGARAAQSLSQMPVSNNSRWMAVRPATVVTTMIRSGRTAGFWCANAQIVSVITAGDIPVTAKRTISEFGVSVLERDFIAGLSGKDDEVFGFGGFVQLVVSRGELEVWQPGVGERNCSGQLQGIGRAKGMRTQEAHRQSPNAFGGRHFVPGASQFYQSRPRQAGIGSLQSRFADASLDGRLAFDRACPRHGHCGIGAQLLETSSGVRFFNQQRDQSGTVPENHRVSDRSATTAAASD